MVGRRESVYPFGESKTFFSLFFSSHQIVDVFSRTTFNLMQFKLIRDEVKCMQMHEEHLSSFLFLCPAHLKGLSVGTLVVINKVLVLNRTDVCVF